MLFLGTDDGLYLSLDAGVNWQKWDEGYPTVSTIDLTIHPREQDLVLGTFGRAAWVLDDIRPLRELAKNRAILENEIKLFPTPDAYLAAYQQPTGSRFGGDALHNAENRKKGAMITYYIKSGHKSEEKTDEEKKGNDSSDESESESEAEVKDGPKVKKRDSIQFEIFEEDRLIRTIKFKTPEKPGFHRVYWKLFEKGSELPSRKISKSKVEPAGPRVRPGSYRIKVHYGDHSDETAINVLKDPRLEVDSASIEEVYEAQKELDTYTKLAYDAVRQLVESKKTVKELTQKLKTLDKEKYSESIKASDKMIKAIDSVLAIYLGKEDKRQGITRNKQMNVSKRIQEAKTYVNTRQHGLTSTENRLMAFAKQELDKAIRKTNDFFSNEWAEYQQKVIALELSPFKEIKTFELD